MLEQQRRERGEETCMTEPTKEQLLEMKAERFDSNSLRFEGLRGDARRHLGRAELAAAIAQLPPAPRDQGTWSVLGGDRR